MAKMQPARFAAPAGWAWQQAHRPMAPSAVTIGLDVPLPTEPFVLSILAAATAAVAVWYPLGDSPFPPLRPPQVRLAPGPIASSQPSGTSRRITHPICL